MDLQKGTRGSWLTRLIGWMVDEHMTESIKHLSPVYTHLTEIQPERIEGIFLYDSAGGRYLDFSSGTGVTYATSSQGVDHTSGLTIRAKIDHLDTTIQVEASRRAQINEIDRVYNWESEILE